MNQRFKIILGILLVYFFFRCDFATDFIIELFSQDYKVDRKEFVPQFVSKDQSRKKIILELKEEFSGLPQITSIAQFPLNPNQFLATIKTGELLVYDFSTKKMTLLKKFNVLTASEQGLLGIAFHPEFNNKPLLYVYYSVEKAKKKYSRISEFKLENSHISKEEAFPFFLKDERILLEIEQPYANHNGGHLEFGPDGYLYIGLGDGGWRDDPHNHSQNPQTLLGSILRIDIKSSKDLPYSIPADNPFVSKKDWRKEIFAIGLRNPWKFSFDPFSQKLIVADVGQDVYEEISIVDKGENFGWRIKEGYACYLDRDQCNRKDLIDPIYVYDHSEGQSITGGYVYTSDQVPELKNKYIFGDFVQGKIWAMDLPLNNQKVAEDSIYSLGKWPILISTFGKTKGGEVLVGDFQSGKIYRFAKSKSK